MHREVAPAAATEHLEESVMPQKCSVPKNSPELLSPVTSGQTMRYTNDQWQQADAPREDEFPVPGEIGFVRWQEWRRDFIKDPSLVAFYSFSHNPDAPETLVNDAGIATDGTIQGARWVSGRWPGKDALLFDRDNDYVDLTISGEYDEITLSFWVKVDRLDYEYNALLNSNGWDPGDLVSPLWVDYIEA